MPRRLFLHAVICAVLLLAGCSRSPQVTYYTLLPGTVPQGAPRAGNSLSVAIGPVTVPEVLDRPQLVVRESDSRLKVLEIHRWGEPLKREIPRVLAQNLSSQLGTDQVSSYPQNAGSDAQYRVQVDIQRFEAVPGQGVTVEALWRVKSADRGMDHGHSLAQEKADGPGYEPLVAAYGRALARVSADLAQAIRSCAQIPPAERGARQP